MIISGKMFMNNTPNISYIRENSINLQITQIIIIMLFITNIPQLNNNNQDNNLRLIKIIIHHQIQHNQDKTIWGQ